MNDVILMIEFPKLTLFNFNLIAFLQILLFHSIRTFCEAPYKIQKIHMTSYRTPRRFNLLKQKSNFCPRITECLNVDEFLKQKTVGDISPPVYN